MEDENKKISNMLSSGLAVIGVGLIICILSPEARETLALLSEQINTKIKQKGDKQNNE